MSDHSVDGTLLRSYLLGELDEAEAARIERDFLAREDALEDVAAAEERLVEDYLEGRCPPDVRLRFETHYLASAVHARRVAMTRGIVARGRTIRRSRPVIPLALAAMLLLGVLAAVLTWITVKHDTPIVLTIPAVVHRDEGDAPTLGLGDGSRSVELRLARLHSEAAPPFRAIMRTVEGDELWQGPAIATPESFVVSIPAGVLLPGDYVVIVLADADGTDPLQRYAFRATAP